MLVELHSCYVLHGRKYRESSLILDVFSSVHGRLGVIARGARKDRNNKRALMQPGREVNMSWSIRRDLGTLRTIEPGADLPVPSGSQLINIFYMNELLVRLLHTHEPHPELFAAYSTALRGLVEEGSAEAVLRLFEKRLLVSLGYGLLLETDSAGEAICPGDYYRYRPECGPVRCGKNRVNESSYSGQTLRALHCEDFSSQSALREAKSLMRDVLAGLLENRPLASRELYKSYMRNIKS